MKIPHFVGVESSRLKQCKQDKNDNYTQPTNQQQQQSRPYEKLKWKAKSKEFFYRKAF